METDVLIITGQNPDEQRSIQINSDDLKLLEEGSLVIDLSLKNGDLIERARETKPDEPIYLRDGVVHFTVTNLPSFVSKTASSILSNVSEKYISQLAQMGFEEAIATNPELRESLVLYRGKIVNSMKTTNL